MKRKLKKKVKILLWIALFAVLTVVAVVAIKPNLNFDFEVKNKVSSKKKNKDNNEQWPKVTKISLVATGDGLLHNAVYMDAYNREKGSFNFAPQLEMVKEEIKDFDIAYYNQETVFGGKQTALFPKEDSMNIAGYSSYPYFNTPSEYGDAMVDAGFNMVSLASNHSLDCTSKAKECILNTIDYWKGKDVIFDGFNPDSEHTNNYIIKEKNNIKYTMLNYTNTLNGLNGHLGNDTYLIDQYDEEKVKKDIAEVRDKVDVLIVAMHWHKDSAEYGTVATESNKQIARFLSDQGVDIVLGTYSHCLQPFEIINDKTVVFYSLGNFISNQGDLVDSIGYKGIVGVLASMDIVKTEEKDGTSSIKIENLGADLTYTYNQNHHNYKVIPFSKMTSEYNPNYQKIFEEYKGVLTSLDTNIKIKEPGSGL